jgi:hypothetical protein
VRWESSWCGSPREAGVVARRGLLVRRGLLLRREASAGCRGLAGRRVLVRRESSAGCRGLAGYGVLTAGGGSPGACGSRGAYRSGSLARLAVIDRAVSRASTCGNCASSGRLPAANAGRAACGTAPSWCRGASGPHWPSPRRAISGHGRSSPAWTPDRRRWSASPGRSRSGLSGRRRRTGPAGRRTVPSIGAKPPPPPGWAGTGRIKPWPCHEGDGERRAGID